MLKSPAKKRARSKKSVNVAAVTMTYNEPDFLPIWARHYSAQVGPRHCYVIDHGSDDGSTDALGDINVVRIPRSPYDEDRCTRCISSFCSAQLEWYDCFIYTDVDEIAVADPVRHASLTTYCAVSKKDVVTAIGFNVAHTKDELPIDPTAGILEQRKWMYFTAPMCKPACTRRPFVWNAGFHRAQDVEPKFDDLYIFHLRYLDRNIGLRRLAKTRAQPWTHADTGWWARVTDDDCLKMFAAIDNRRKNAKVEVSKASGPVLDALSRTLGSSGGRLGEPDTYDLSYEVGELWPIPERFRPVF
jgi:Glycosyl transferase family 2